VRFESPPTLRVTVEGLPHRGTLTGMGVPAGVTLIVVSETRAALRLSAVRLLVFLLWLLSSW
jgi:hypothetical protein